MQWDWETGIPKLTFEPGHEHLRSAFRVKIMPYSDDRSLITCAGDGEVRHAQISQCGVETRLLAKDQHIAYDLAFEPGSPHLIYICVLASSGADGIKIWTPKAIDKAKLPTTKIELDQQDGIHVRPDMDSECYMLNVSAMNTFEDKTYIWPEQWYVDEIRYNRPRVRVLSYQEKLSAFLLPNIYSAIVRSANHVL
ncbi:hypothetical protein V6N13_122035 [Hibiscus sabdariffa]